MEKIIKNNDCNSFSVKKNKIIEMINSLMEEYDSFTKTVSTKNWRTTGHHYSELKKMKQDIVKFSELTENEKDNNWVKKQII